MSGSTAVSFMCSDLVLSNYRIIGLLFPLMYTFSSVLEEEPM